MSMFRLSVYFAGSQSMQGNKAVWMSMAVLVDVLIAVQRYMFCVAELVGGSIDTTLLHNRSHDDRHHNTAPRHTKPGGCGMAYLYN